MGSLIGTAVGDSLGASFEGYLGAGLGEVDIIAERQKMLTYSDDTHMMIGFSLIHSSSMPTGQWSEPTTPLIINALVTEFSRSSLTKM